MPRTRIPFFCAFILLLFSLVPSAQAQPVAAPAYTSDPAIVTAPATTSVKLGSPATFTVTAWGASTLKYQWYRNGTLINGATAARYTTPATTNADNGSSFTVQVSDKAGSLTSSYATLWVADSAPAIQMQPASLTVTAPALATFQAYATVQGAYSPAPITVQWYKNGSPVGNPGTGAWTTYTTEETNTADNGAKFTVKFTNAAGSVTSNPAILRVNPANISGTYPIVGEWTGTAKTTNPDGTTETVQALVAFAQNSYSLTGTVVYTEDSGVPVYGVGVASLNNTNISITAEFDGGTVSMAAGFTSDLLTLNGLGGGLNDSNGPSSGGGKFVISSDHSTLTGAATLSDGTTITWKLTRAK